MNHKGTENTEKKKKGKPQRRPTLARYVMILALVFVIAGSIAAYFLVSSDTESADYYIPITPLAPELLPTADAILDNPDSEGDFVDDYTVNRRGSCFEIIKQNTDAPNYSSIRILVNEQEIQYRISDLRDSCHLLIATMLEGMYIVEVQLLDDALNPMATYRHAIEIEAE